MKRGFLNNKKAALYPKVKSTTAEVASSVSAPASSATRAVATGECQFYEVGFSYALTLAIADREPVVEVVKLPYGKIENTGPFLIEKIDHNFNQLHSPTRGLRPHQASCFRIWCYKDQSASNNHHSLALGRAASRSRWPQPVDRQWVHKEQNTQRARVPTARPQTARGKSI